MPQEQSSAAPIVLIVEIDVLLRLVTASNLRNAGFEVIEAANPAEALRSWIVSR
jgi:CheY-like chemotaxis protein